MDFMDWFGIFIIVFFGSLMIANIVVTVKESNKNKNNSEGEKLKKARERNYKRELKNNIKIIKNRYVNNKCFVEISFSMSHYEKGVSEIEKWLDDNNIQYETINDGCSYWWKIKFLD